MDAHPLLREAEAIGPSTIALVERILAAKPHPEQGFRACLGILRLVRSYGPERLEAACQRGVDIGARTYSSVQSILRNGLDRAFRPDPVPDELRAYSVPLYETSPKYRSR